MSDLLVEDLPAVDRERGGHRRHPVRRTDRAVRDRVVGIDARVREVHTAQVGEPLFDDDRRTTIDRRERPHPRGARALPDQATRPS